MCGLVRRARCKIVLGWRAGGLFGAESGDNCAQTHATSDLLSFRATVSIKHKEFGLTGSGRDAQQLGLEQI